MALQSRADNDASAKKFDPLKSIGTLKLLRNLRDDIISATKREGGREGPRWLWEDYEEEANAWMDKVTAKICSMYYSPDEFLKDMSDFRHEVNKPPKKIAGLDWLQLNDLFDGVLEKVKDVWISATISSKAQCDRDIPDFTFRDPMDGSVVDIVTDTARALAAADTHPSSFISSNGDPLFAPINSGSAAALPLDARVSQGIRDTAAHAMRSVFDRGAAAGAALVAARNNRGSFTSGGGFGGGSYDAGRKRPHAMAGAGRDDDRSGLSLAYTASAPAPAQAPPKKAIKLDRRAAAAAAPSALAEGAWLRIDEAASKATKAGHGGRGSSGGVRGGSSRRAPAPPQPQPRGQPQSTDLFPPAPDVQQVSSSSSSSLSSSSSSAAAAEGWVEIPEGGGGTSTRVGVTPVVWVEPKGGNKDVANRPPAAKRTDVHYQVAVRVANKTFVLRVFAAEDDAARAHDRALIRACGPEPLHAFWADRLAWMAEKLDVAEAAAAAGALEEGGGGGGPPTPALRPLPALDSWLALNYPVWAYASDPLDWCAAPVSRLPLPHPSFSILPSPALSSPLTLPSSRPCATPSPYLLLACRFTEFDDVMRTELLATAWKGPRPCDFGFIFKFPPGAQRAWDNQLERVMALYRLAVAAPPPP